MSKSAAVLILLGLLAGSGALAQGPERQWLMPDPQIQKDMDPTLVPVSRGAVLVPSMAGPDTEPMYELHQGPRRIGSARCGTRIIAEPGEYSVVIIGNTEPFSVRRDVRILEGKTTVVDPDWSGLRVTVIDENGIPVRGAYEVISLPSMKNLGVGFGARVERGELLTTWLMEPGLYMILKLGESYQARKNVVTFRLRPGFLERITVVMDSETGDFLAAGEMLFGDLDVGKTREFNASAVIGGGVAFASQQNIPGSANETSVDPEVFVDAVATYARQKHFWYFRLSINELFTQTDWKVFEKKTDIFRVDALYSYRLNPYLGPYARLGMETTIFPAISYFEPRTDVVQLRRGAVVRTWPVRDEFYLAPNFFPLVLKGGTGLRLNTPSLPFLDFWALIGVGGRITFAKDTYVSIDNSTTPAYEIEAVNSFGSPGLESTLVGRANLGRWVTLNTEFEVFLPFDRPESPALRWDATTSLRLTAWVSINYIYRMKWEPEIIEGLQQDHQALLRFSFKLF